MDEKLIEIIEKMEAAGETPQAISEVVKAYNVKKKDFSEVISEDQPLVSEQEVGTSDASGVTEDINEYIVPTPVVQEHVPDGPNLMEFEPLNLGDQEQIRLQEKKTAARHIPNPSLVKANRIKKEQETAMMLERASGVEPLDDNSIISETRAALPGSDVNKAKAEKKALEAEKKALEAEKKALEESEALDLAEYLISKEGLKISPSELVKDKERMKRLSLANKKTKEDPYDQGDPYAGLREATKQMRVIEPKSKEAAEALGREWNPDAAKERVAESENRLKKKKRIIELRDAYAAELLKELGEEIKETDYLKELLEVDGDEELAKKNLKDGLNEMSTLFLTDTERSIKKLQTEIDMLETIKNGGGTWNEKQRNAYIEKVNSIQAFRYDEKELGTSQLYDPVTGAFIQNERADKATVDFNETLDEELLKYEDSGRGDLEKRRNELYYALKTEVMEILLRQQPKDRNPFNVRRDGDGNVIPMTKKEILDQSELNSKAFPFSYGALITGGSRNSGDFSNWINILNSPHLYTDEQKADANELYARFIGINRALNLNEDPGTLREGGFIEGVVEVFDKALDGTKGEKFDKTEVFMTEMKSMGIPLTEQQEREMGQSFSKTLGSTVAESAILMVDIAANGILLGGTGSALKIPARIRKLSRTLGGGNKAMQFGYNLALQSAAYEMAGQSAFSGAGEYAAESGAGAALEKLGSKNAMVNFILKLAAGTGGETIAEYTGGFAENFAKSGDIQRAAEDTFGKTVEEREEIFWLTFTTSLMFSSVGLTSREIANSKRNARNMLIESGSQSPIVIEGIEILTKELEAAEEQKTSLTQKKDEAVSAVQNALAEAKKSGGEAMVDGKVVTEATIKEIEDAYESKVSELEIVDVNEYRRTSKDEKNPEVKKLKEQIEGLRDEDGLIPQDKKTELDRLNKAIAKVEAQPTSEVEVLKSEKATKLAILDSKVAESEKTGAIPVDENGNALMVKEEKAKIEAEYDAKIKEVEAQTTSEVDNQSKIDEINKKKEESKNNPVKEPKEYAKAVDDYKSTDLGSNEDAKNKKEAVVKQAQTKEGKAFVENQVAQMDYNEDGTITVYRSGTLQEGHNPATTNKQTAEIISSERKKQGLSSDIIEIKIQPSDISAVVPGVESEVLININKANSDRIKKGTKKEQKNKEQLTLEKESVKNELEKTTQALKNAKKDKADGTFKFSDNVYNDVVKKQEAKIKNLEWQLKKYDAEIAALEPTTTSEVEAVFDDASVKEAKRFIEDKNTKKLTIEEVINQDENATDLDKSLLKALSPFLKGKSVYYQDGFKFNVENEIVDDTGGYGATISENGDVLIFTKGNLDVDTILHEGLHTLIYTKINDTVRNEQDQVLVDELQRIFELVKSSELSTREEYSYAFNNLDEFVSEAFGNKNFRQELSYLEDTEGSKSNLFTSFINALRNFLKSEYDFDLTSNALESIFGAVENTLKQTRKTSEVEAKEAEIEEKSNLEITEVEEYVDELDKTKKSDPKVYWSVSEVSEVDAKEGTVVNTEDGSALVKKDGDIVGVFKKITSKAKGVAQDLLKRAVKAGGTKLDNFDGYLTKQYEKAGFRVVSRTPFNEEYAPEGWDKDAHGTPDVVAMVYDPKGELDIEEKSFNDYDEAISYRDSMVPETKVEQNKTVSGQTLSDPKSTTQKRGESLAAEFKEMEASKKDTSKIEEQVENAKKAIAKVSPKTKIVVHKTAKDYKNSGKNRKQNEGGEYDIEKDTIHINLESANERTIAHEVFHALLLSKGMSNKQAKAVTEKMLKAVKKTASPELLKKLEDFSGRYILRDEAGNPILDKDGNTIPDPVQSEESIAELFGILAAGYPTLPKPTQNIIKRWLDKLAKLFGLKMFTDNEVVDMLNVVSKKVKEGVEISEKELKPIRKKVDIEKEFEGGIPVDELTDEDLDQDQTSQWGESGSDMTAVTRKQITEESIENSRVDDINTDYTYVFDDYGRGITLPNKQTIKSVLEKSGGYAVFINSDGTKVGVRSNGEMLDGGWQYSLIDENVESKIGFAATSATHVKTLHKMVSELTSQRDTINPKSKGKPITVFVTVQNGETMLGEWYAGEYFFEGIDKAITENKFKNGVDTFKSLITDAVTFTSKINASRKKIRELNKQSQTAKTKKKIKALKKRIIGLKKKASNRETIALLKLINSDKFKTHDGRIEIAKEFASKKFTFGFRVNLLKTLIPLKSPTGGNVEIKKALLDVGYGRKEFYQEHLDGSLLDHLVESNYDETSIGGITLGGFYIDPYVSMKEFFDNRKNGIDHAQFNESFSSNGEVFRLDGAHNVNALNPHMGYPTTNGYAVYNKENGSNINKKNASIEQRHDIVTYLDNKYGNKKDGKNLFALPFTSIGGSMYTPTDSEIEFNDSPKKPSRSRKQLPADDLTKIEAVRKLAQEKGYTEAELKVALEKLGFSKAEINSTKEKSITDAQEKFDTSIKRGNTKADAVKSALGDLMSTTWYSITTDTKRDAAVKELMESLGEKIEKAPSVKKIMGDKSKPEKQTKTVKSLRKEFWKMWNKAFRDSKIDQDTKRKEISEAISDIINESRGDAVVKKKKLDAIQKRINRTNLNNPVMVERLLNYIEKVMVNADHIAKIAEANKNKTRIRKLTKKGEKDANLTASAKAFIQIDPNLVEDIDLYLEKSNEIVDGLKPTSITANKNNVSSKFNTVEMDKYTEKELSNQQDKIKASVNNHFEELTGISGSGMSLSEMMEVIEIMDDSKEAKPDISKLDPIEKANIKKAYDAYASIVLAMAKTNTDPFTGESLGLSKEDIALATKLANLDILDMNKVESIKAIDALSNFTVNQSLAGAQAIVSMAEGNQNTNKLAEGGVKTRKLKQYFSKGIGRLLAEQLMSLPLVMERMYGKTKAIMVSRLSGLTGVINGNAKATKMSEKIVSSYLSKFGKTKPNKQEFNTAENIHERGVIAFMMRTVSGNEEAEFKRRKGWIEQSIAKLSEGTKKDKAKSEAYQEVYDKLLKDSDTIEDVLQKSDKKNIEAVNWWVNEWSKHYAQLQKTNLEVYNEILDSDGNYTPDVTKKMDEKREVDLLQSTFASASGRLDKSKSGSLIKATKPNKIPLDRYISLDFDVNNANTIQSALIDINTAKDILKLQGFLNSPALKEIIETKEDRDLFKRRIYDYVSSVKRSNHVDRSELQNLSKGLEIAAAVGVARALGGVTQGVKQTIPVMLNTLINSGRLDFSNLFDPDVRAFIDNSGMPISNRGMASQASLDHIERLLEKASKTRGGALVKNLEDLQRFYLKLFLQNPDVFVARASFISYYKQALNKKGKKVEDWSTHELDQEAADYAQQQVDRQQNVSDEYLQGKLFTSKDPIIKIVRKTVFPFANFTQNQKARMATDMVALAARTTSKSDRVSAMRSLSGLSVEMMAFYSLRILIATGIWSAAKAWMGYDEDDEEADKRMKNQMKGSYTSMAKDLLSPVPMLDAPAIAGMNKLLNVLQGDLERDTNGNIKKGQEENFEFFGKYEEGLWDDWGVLGIAADKVDDMFAKTKTAATGKYIDKGQFWNVERTLTGDDKEGMMASATLSILYNLGVLPSEFGTLSNNIEKISKKSSRKKEKEKKKKKKK